MTKRSEKNELIDKFLREELTEGELVTFRKLWDSDPAFVKEVQDYSRMTIALKAADRLDEDKKKTRTAFIAPFRKAFFKYQSVAAIFLLAIMLPLYLLLQGQKRAITAKSPEIKILAQNHFIKDRLNNHLAQDENTGLSEAISVYAEGQVQEAITLIRQVEKENDRRYPLILADLHFEMGQPDSAIYFYSIGLKDNPKDSSAYWNRLMAQMAFGKLAEIKETLNVLSKSENAHFRDKADQILTSIE